MDKNDINEKLDKLFGKNDNAAIDIMRPRYHVTITNNENGAIEHDSDTNCICGAFDSNDNRTVVIRMSNCNAPIYAATIAGALSAVDTALKDKPFVKLLVEVMRQHRNDD